MKRALLSLIAVAVFALAANQRAFGALKNTAAFLQTGGSARAVALNNAYTAAGGDLDAMTFNPGALASLGRGAIALTHSEEVLGTNLDMVQVGQMFGRTAIGLSYLRSAIGSLDQRDASGQSTGKFSVENQALSLVGAHALSQRLSAGVGAKMVRSRIGSNSDAVPAFDAGLLGRLSSARVWYGLSVLNMGGSLRYRSESEPLPLTLAAGVALETTAFRYLIDVKDEPQDFRTTVTAGAEFIPSSGIFIRGGYASIFDGRPSNRLGDLDRFRGGLGLWLSRFQLDYAIAPFSNLGATHRFTLSTFF